MLTFLFQEQILTQISQNEGRGKMDEGRGKMLLVPLFPGGTVLIS
jgi:hypothetical protein